MDFNEIRLTECGGMQINSADNKSKNKNRGDPKDKTKEKSRYQEWKERVDKEIRTKVRREGKSILVLKFFIAPILFIIGFAFLYLILDLPTFGLMSGFMVAYFFPPLGKESVIPLAVIAGIDWIQIALAIAYVDIIVALFLLWNYDFAKLAPVLGPWMERFERRAVDISKGRLWMKGLTFIGVVLFVMFPFQGSGGVGATIVGRLIGMNRYVLFAGICVGAVSGTLLIGYISHLGMDFKEVFMQDLYLWIPIFIVIAIFIGFILIRRRTKKNKVESE
jgi:hypothetical protein